MSTMMNRRAFVGGASMMIAAGCAGRLGSCGRNGPIRLKKTGTYDILIVEANPIVFRGRLLLMEYIRHMSPVKRYRFNDTGHSYFRFRDMSDMKTFSPSFGEGLHLGNAFVDGDRVVVTAVEDWGASRFYQMESQDLVHWTKPRVILEDPAWEGYNTTLCRADGRYVLSFELGAPEKLVGHAFTLFFAESKDLVDWKPIDGARMGYERYTGAPMLRWHDGVYYYFHLDGSYEKGFNTRVVRSRDLMEWEMSPHVVLDFDASDKMLHPMSDFTDKEKIQIAAAKDINVSDLDMCEYGDRLVCFYSWGNQQGNEFSALAEANCSEKEFCESFFL